MSASEQLDLHHAACRELDGFCAVCGFRADARGHATRAHVEVVRYWLDHLGSHV